MKRIEKLAVLLLLAFAFCGCTRTSEVKAEEKLAVQEEAKARATEQTAETVQTGPETITTTTEEFEEVIPSEPERSSEPESESKPADHPHGLAVTPGGAASSFAPRIIKRTVTVDQRGPVLDTKTASTQTAKDTSLAEKQEKASDTKKKTSFALPWWVWALGACGVALGIAIVRKTLLGKAVAAAEAAAKEVL